MVRRPACRRRRDLEAQAPKIELVEEDFDHPRRIVFADVVIQAARQQRRLPAILTLDETAHPKPPTRRCQESELLRVLHSLGRKRSSALSRIQDVRARPGMSGNWSD